MQVKTIIRAAEQKDVPNLTLMGREFFEATGYLGRSLRIDPFQLHQFLESAIESPDVGIFVAERDGLLVGVIGIAASTTFYGFQKIANELFWWVRSHARTGPAAIRLLKSAEKWALDAGCAVISMVDIACMESAAPRIYSRSGYAIAERTWIKPLS